MVGKAEQLVDSSGETGANPRFVVTSLNPAAWAAQPLYERLYCARGEMENRTKEELPARPVRGSTSSKTMRAHQLRLWFASLAYALLAFRHVPGQAQVN